MIKVKIGTIASKARILIPSFGAKTDLLTQQYLVYLT